MRKSREPSLLRKVIEIHYEQAQRRKALRLLNRQQWSVEFLEHLVQHAAKALNTEIEIEVESPQGHKLRIKSAMADSRLDTNNDIFNRLDDAAAVRAFISEHSRR